ncbi:MAG: hypothetical protein ACR2NY_03960, partial [Alphaproteobacteria bacterium]
MQDSITIKRAILSVSDKTNLFDLASCLKKHQVDIVASAGTAEFLHSLHITTTSVESITNFPEILEGRVKTLHPHIHGGILARRDNENDEKNLSQHHIKKIDLVVVNLYRFLEKLAKKLPDETMLDHIDIGGVALIRAGGKNFSSVAVVVDPK